MEIIRLGIIKEGKTPPDKRVPFSPLQVVEIEQRYPHVKVVVQESSVRAFTDDEYREKGIEVKSDVSDCEILMGIKEVPISDLIPRKTYLFFSHTIKKQPYNKKLLQAILNAKIRLVDYEALKDKLDNRLVAFGRFAGIVGAYNGLLTYGNRYKLFSLRKASECFDLNDLKIELRKVKLPPIKIILTGGGRVARGAMETLDTAGIRKVNPGDFLTNTYNEAVYVQLSSADYHVRKEGGLFNREEFHQTPQHYKSTFIQFAQKADLLVAGAFWNPKAPVLFTKEQMTKSDFKIKIIADVTCDIEGSIPSTKMPSTIADPIYDYNPVKDTVEPPLSNSDFITVMAVDNLPCELPRSASEEFGRDLIDKILPALVISDKESVIKRASITKGGKLTENFLYLSDYAYE
ncbi:MAG: alanine dehydrogenase [Cyclobacteriaceae bacterium]|nr:alanine dehydrogenase [Cyclobacteriaceae bacterium]